ncbi:MAG: starch-binding protein, partial [Bacteroidales bacterium]|nr:starch-binding protein [Bacteroidales bacterium]
EIEFKKGCPIDKGPTIPLKESGRAYYGGYISGTLNVNDFASYTNATGNVAVTLKHPLARHIQRLSQIRMAIPALRKGEYSTEGQQNNLAFKRRYVDATTDSYVCVAISESFTFNNVLNGTYVDAITGDTKVVSNNKLTVNVSGKGNMRVYVLNTDKTPAPGKIGVDGKYLYGTTPVIEDQGTYPDETEPLIGSSEEPETPQEPVLNIGEKAIFFEKPSNWGSNINVYIYYDNNGTVVKITKSWPGDAATKLGNNVYKYNFEGEITNWKVLFNDGSNQAPSSIGFDVVNGGYYTVNGLHHVIQPSANAVDNIFSRGKFTVSSGQNMLNINSTVEGVYPLYSVSGTVIKMLDIKRGQNAYYDIPKGIYLIDHQKVIIY